MERRRLELPTSSLQSYEPIPDDTVNTVVSEGGCPTPSNSPSDSTPKPLPATPTDPELAAVVKAWPTLPPAIRAAVTALVNAGKGDPSGEGKA